MAKANQALSGRADQGRRRQYLDILLRGGSFSVLGRTFDVLGLQRSDAILAAAERTARPRTTRSAARSSRSRRFAQLAIDNLDLSDPVLGAIASPIRVKARSRRRADDARWTASPSRRR